MAMLRICVVKLFHPYLANWSRRGAALAARDGGRGTLPRVRCTIRLGSEGTKTQEYCVDYIPKRHFPQGSERRDGALGRICFGNWRGLRYTSAEIMARENLPKHPAEASPAPSMVGAGAGLSGKASRCSRMSAALVSENWLTRMALILIFALYARAIGFAPVYDDNVITPWDSWRDVPKFFTHDIFGYDTTAHSVYYRPLAVTWGFALVHCTGARPDGCTWERFLCTWRWWCWPTPSDAGCSATGGWRC